MLFAINADKIWTAPLLQTLDKHEPKLYYLTSSNHELLASIAEKLSPFSDLDDSADFSIDQLICHSSSGPIKTWAIPFLSERELNHVKTSHPSLQTLNNLDELHHALSEKTIVSAQGSFIDKALPSSKPFKVRTRPLEISVANRGQPSPLP